MRRWSQIDAKSRLAATRRAIERLDEIHLLLMYGGDDWQPDHIRTRTDKSDPTANRAIYAVDELAEKLVALRQEERELTELIGETLAIIRGVREGLGDKYADVLDARYIDGTPWSGIVDGDGREIKSTTARRMVDVACDWIDSVGVSRLMRGEIEL